MVESIGEENVHRSQQGVVDGARAKFALKFRLYFVGGYVAVVGNKAAADVSCGGNGAKIGRASCRERV